MKVHPAYLLHSLDYYYVTCRHKCLPSNKIRNINLKKKYFYECCTEGTKKTKGCNTAIMTIYSTSSKQIATHL